MPRPKVHAPVGIENGEGLCQVGEIGERFAHSHEDNVADRVARLVFCRHDLPYDFSGTEIASESRKTARAEFAVVSTPNLARNAKSDPSAALAVKVGIRRDFHCFDETPVVETEKKFSGGVLGTSQADRGKKPDREFLFELLPKIVAQVRHLIERCDSFLKKPFYNLLCPEFWLIALFHPLDPVIERHSVGGCLVHTRFARQKVKGET